MKFYKILLIIYLCLCKNILFGQNLDYNVENLKKKSPHLFENSNLIVRNYQLIATIQNKGKMIKKINYICTILDKSGEEEVDLVLHDNKLVKIKSFEGKLYDSQGKQIQKIKKGDLKEYSNDKSYEVTDTKQKYPSFNHTQFPYTIELEYELESTNLMFYPFFRPQNDSRTSVEQAYFEIIVPNNITFRFKEKNMPQKVKISTKETNKSYTWQLDNIKAFKQETFSKIWFENTPHVITAPNEFEVEGYEGVLSDWDSFGKFQSLLNKDRDIIPENTQNIIKKLVESETDEVIKTKKIYEYMQSKTRYVSIQLGIGGWQTLPAEFVDKNGYGDCKALSNYTKSLLKVVGINSHYTLVYAGNSPYSRNFDKDFVRSQFNHIILCVPLKKDTVWLECTSQRQEFGFLGSFTDDRYALLVTDEGGKLVKTPKYSQKQNIKSENINIKIDENGNAELDINSIYSGLQTEKLRDIIHDSKQEQQKWLYENIDLPEFKIINYEITKIQSTIPTINIQLKTNVQKVAQKMGKRLFITPNLMNKTKFRVPPIENKTEDIFLSGYDYMDTDTLTYHFPDKYHLEGQVKEQKISSVFGDYNTNIKIEQGKMIYIRKIAIKKGVYPKEKYKELTEFYQQIEKADNIKVVFVQGT